MVQWEAMSYMWKECCATNPQTWVLLPGSPFPNHDISIIMTLVMQLTPVNLSFLLKMKTIIPAVSTPRVVVRSQHQWQCSRKHSILSKKVHLDCDCIPHRYQCIYFYFNWTIVDLQCCLSFRWTVKWFGYILFSDIFSL